MSGDAKGYSTSKIENKFSLRMLQNANIVLKDVFVPDCDKLTFATDFASGTEKILMASRL